MARAEAEDTNIVILVTDRKQRDLVKEFEETNIDWSVIEKQLVVWSDLFRAGNQLRVKFSFKYVDAGYQSAMSSRKTVDKRGSTSTTHRMLSERVA